MMNIGETITELDRLNRLCLCADTSETAKAAKRIILGALPKVTRIAAAKNSLLPPAVIESAHTQHHNSTNRWCNENSIFFAVKDKRPYLVEWKFLSKHHRYAVLTWNEDHWLDDDDNVFEIKGGITGIWHIPVELRGNTL